MLIELLKAFFLGVIEGITEWLPISSTGHMIIFNEFVKLDVSEEFWSMFEVVIQLGAILAVVVLFAKKLIPFGFGKTKSERRETWTLWGRILIACIPAAVIGILLDDWLDEHLYNYVTVAAALIVYGVLFIVIERLHKGKKYIINSSCDIDNRTALKIGAFQLLSLVPGTSRSGSTILGGMCVGVSRTGAAEFSFFLAVPVMIGASLLKLVKYVAGVGLSFSSTELAVLAVGVITAFVVSLIAIRFLMNFVRRHSFEAFGWYRIILGIVVLGFFLVRGK